MRVAWGGVGYREGQQADLTKTASFLPPWELWSVLRAPPISLPLLPPPPALDHPAGWSPPSQPSGPPLTPPSPPSPPCMLHAAPSEGIPHPVVQSFETTFLFMCLFLLLGLLFLYITHTNKMDRSRVSSRDRHPLFWEPFSPTSSPILRLLPQIPPSPVVSSDPRPCSLPEI